jgi:hypothetical protein
MMTGTDMDSYLAEELMVWHKGTHYNAQGDVFAHFWADGQDCGGSGTCVDRNGDMYVESSWYDYPCPTCGWLDEVFNIIASDKEKNNGEQK